MKVSRLLTVAAATLVLAGAWCWHAAAQWRASLPWPDQANAPGRPWTTPLRQGYATASRWPVHRDAIEQLARLYLANGFNTEAAVLLPGIIARRPEAPEWVHRRAVLLADAGELPEAVALWQSILPVTRTHLPVRVKLADALVKLNRETEAATLYRDLLAEHPGQPYAWLGLIRLDVQAGRWNDAREKLARAIAGAPDFYGHYALLQAVATHFGDEAGRAEADRQVKRLGRFRDIPDPWTEPAIEDCYDPYRLRVDADRLRSEAEATGGRTNLAGALARLDRAIALAPSDPLNYQLLATVQGLRGDDAAARRAFERGLELDPRSSTLYLRFASLLGRQGHADEARELLQRGAVHCPDDPELAQRHADLCARAGLWADAAASYRRVAALRPGQPEAALTAATAAFRAGDEPGGVALLRANLARHPRHEPTLGYLVMNAVHQGDAASARELSARLLQVAPDSPATAEILRRVQARFGPGP